MMLRFIDLSKALRYIPGHKHIVLFSSGIPYSLIHGIETNDPFPIIPGRNGYGPEGQI